MDPGTSCQNVVAEVVIPDHVVKSTLLILSATDIA
jgi:hypothetical protein